MTRHLHALSWCALFGLIVSGSPAVARNDTAPVQRSSATNQQAASAGDALAAEYQIGPEDKIEVLVWNNENLSRTVSVRPDGRISLPLLNDVVAAGLTPLQLRDTLTKGFSRYTQEPEVSVIVSEIHSLKIAVVGMVKTPGRFELKSRATVLDALAMAGGLMDFAKSDRIVIFRPNGRGGTSPIGFDYRRLLTDLDVQQNFVLQPGDIIVVP
jgi:polysaccharide export outer membrane protein